MANKRKKIKSGAKLLNAWKPPESAGAPVGCMATTFTFSPVFFEEECIGRFLQMQSHATEDGPMYVIEREEKLADVKCVSVLVDINHCKGNRSLRWDLIPARVNKAIQHSKISILYWRNLIRVIIASANLTEDGYRRNREIFGIVDYGEGGDAPIVFLDEIINFLRDAAVVATGNIGENSPAVNRWNGFLDSVSEVSRRWGSDKAFGGKKAVRVHPVLVGPGRPGVFEQVHTFWPEGSPPAHAIVTSPFFDSPGVPNKPAEALWGSLRQRGAATVKFNLTAEEVVGESAIFLHAPEEIKTAEPGRSSTQTFIDQIPAHAKDEGAAIRPLHLKSIWFVGHDWYGYLIGSSNFTSYGLGLSRTPNKEANMLYLVSESGNPSAFRMLNQESIDGDPIDQNLKLLWKPRSDKCEDAGDEESVLLPSAFGSATYVKTKEVVRIELNFHGSPPKGWKTFKKESTDDIFIDEAQWQHQGAPQTLCLNWTDETTPSGFEVSWSNCIGRAWWPINVDRAASLPPPEELKDLPLDILVNILTSARPLHQVLKNWINRKKETGSASSIADIIDPHKRVDTSAFLLQKTYRVTVALSGLRQKLERPVPSKDSLEWRLRGPVGVSAVAKAILSEARSSEEKAFLLTELAMEISRAHPKTAPGCLPKREIQKQIKEVVLEIKKQAYVHLSEAPPSLKQYIRSAFREAVQ